MDTNMEKQELEQDIDLMPHHQEGDLPTSLDPEEEKVPSDQGDTEILGDNLEEEMHNISFDESQNKVVQSHRVSTLDDHTSPTQFEEQVIVLDVCKHPTTLADVTNGQERRRTSSSICLSRVEEGNTI